MEIIQTIERLRAFRRGLLGTVGLVPTMGYLHAGHLSLIEAARADNDHVIATIFVNPTQFSPTEDLSAYPRDLPNDLALLREAGVSAVFTPTPDMIYPKGFQTYVSVEQVSIGKEGGSRPTHFRGVATVVCKLFNLIQPDTAYFGQKDAQQVVVIRQMVRDLNFPLAVVVCPIVREKDGLALSSRNVYLSPEERSVALAINQALRAVGDAFAKGERHPDRLKQVAVNFMAQYPLAQTDYVSVALASTMQELENPTEQAIIVSLAVKVGKPRLLDNCLLPMVLNTRKGATSTLGIGE